jgi:hypothetical protein
MATDNVGNREGRQHTSNNNTKDKTMRNNTTLFDFFHREQALKLEESGAWLSRV